MKTSVKLMPAKKGQRTTLTCSVNPATAHTRPISINMIPTTDAGAYQRRNAPTIMSTTRMMKGNALA